MKPVVSKLLQEGYKIKYKNVADYQELAADYGVRSVPTFIYIVDGKEVRRKTGSQSESQLRSMWRKSFW